MSPLEQALSEVCGVLEQEQIAYALIGGYAAQYYGEPRMTHDLQEIEQLLRTPPEGI